MDVSALGSRVSDRIQPWRPVLWTLITVASLLPFGARGVVAAAVVALGGGSVIVAERERVPAWWRLALLLVCAGAGLVAVLLAPSGLGAVPVLVVGSLLPRLLPRRPAFVVSWLVGLAFAVTVGIASDTLYTLYGVIAGAAVPLLTARSADRVALRAERDRATALLAELQERRAADLDAAATEERARIARDLHDVLAHTLSGLSLHLQAARAVAARGGADPTLTETVDRAADLARTGLDEAREAVAALRADRPVPRREELTALVDAHEHASLVVEGAFDELDAGVRAAAFATVREGLTNAGRYAPGAAVSVRAEARPPRGLELRVQDAGGPPPATTDAAPGGGLGLVGLTERAAAVGGTLQAGPEGAGWSVTLRVPGEGP